MGLFNLFKGHAKDKKNDSMPVHNGPTYLEGFASPIQNFKDKTGQWRAKLVSPDGNTQFKIKYYGQRHEKSENLIVGTEIAPPLVLAVHITTEDTILLFDGCKHGYNALFCDTYSTKQLEARSATNFYTTQHWN